VSKPDQHLLERAQAGDGDAFEELMRPHVASVRRFAYAFTRDWTDADDLAQEALLKALSALGSFEARASLRTWLYTLTRNVCHDYHRSRLARHREQDRSLDGTDEGDECADSLALPDELLVSKTDAEQLWLLLKQLPPELRVPLVLYEVEGMAYEEIAKIEAVPLGTIRSRLSRARQQLRALLVQQAAHTAPPSRSAGQGTSPESTT
jgi:RNA polymerase sigma-70 factor (ECF subfamily)